MADSGSLARSLFHPSLFYHGKLCLSFNPLIESKLSLSVHPSITPFSNDRAPLLTDSTPFSLAIHSFCHFSTVLLVKTSMPPLIDPALGSVDSPFHWIT